MTETYHVLSACAQIYGSIYASIQLQLLVCDNELLENIPSHLHRGTMDSAADRRVGGSNSTWGEGTAQTHSTLFVPRNRFFHFARGFQSM